jgi:hypothetical protein
MPEPQKRPEVPSVKLRLDTRQHDAHLCGRKKNAVTVHIFPAGQPPECEEDERWEPERRRRP